MKDPRPLSRWRIVIALVQLESVIAIVAGMACLFGHLSGATLATILVGLLGTSRVPAAVRIVRGEPRSSDDDDGPSTMPPGGSSAASYSPRRSAPGVVITSVVLTLVAGLGQWRHLWGKGS